MKLEIMNFSEIRLVIEGFEKWESVDVPLKDFVGRFSHVKRVGI